MAWPSLAARTKDWGTETLTDADLEGQLDLLVTYVNDMMDSTSGHKHDATTAEGPKILINNLTIASRAQGDIYYDNGTNPTRLAAGTSGQFLKTQGDGANPLWATVNQDQSQAGSTVQVKYASSASVDTTSTAIPFDDSIPQKTEGEEEYSLTITPTSATNKLKIEIVGYVEGSTAGAHTCLALFQDSTADALACGFHAQIGSGEINCISFTHYMDAGTTSATTFKVNYGTSSGTATINGAGGVRKGGGVLFSSITVTEIKV